MNAHHPEYCPGCGRGLLRPPAPLTGYRYSDAIGIEVSTVYDGVLYWQCPLCRHRWHRFAEGHPLRARAVRFVGVE